MTIRAPLRPPAIGPDPGAIGRLTLAFSSRAIRALVRTRAAWMRRSAARRLSAADARRLCLGSGGAPIEGWVNVDLMPPADVLLDVRYGIPMADGLVDRIYAEHLVEHLTLEEGMELMRECRRVLSAGGVLRLATPDLRDIVSDYASGWRRHHWVQWPEYAWVDTGVRMLNVAMRGWGHRYLYDEDELSLRLRQAGFAEVERARLGESRHPDLRGLETRADSSLVIEAWGTA